MYEIARSTIGRNLFYISSVSYYNNMNLIDKGLNLIKRDVKEKQYRTICVRDVGLPGRGIMNAG